MNETLKSLMKNKMALVAIGFVIVVVVVAIVSAPKPSTNEEAKVQTDPVEISNYEEFVSNLPEKERNLIEQALRNIINNNGKETTLPKDAKIREGSYSQNEADDTYYSSFIVDIPSLNQSYKITDRYNPSVPDSARWEYSVMALCLETGLQVYDNQTCQDHYAVEYEMPRSDGIFQYLPYESDNLAISVKPGHFDRGENKVVINVWSGVMNKEQAGTAADNWLRSRNLNPDNYVKLIKVDA